MEAVCQIQESNWRKETGYRPRSPVAESHIREVRHNQAAVVARNLEAVASIRAEVVNIRAVLANTPVVPVDTEAEQRILSEAVDLGN